MEINVDLGKEYAEAWPIKTFNENYSDKRGIRKSFVLSVVDYEFPERVAPIIVRMFIENRTKAKTDQKYIIGLRFYSFGEMATIDLISLENDYHREICYEHLKRMNSPLWSNNLEVIDHYSETTRAPFMFAGGHLRVLDDTSINFFSDSGDYGKSLFFSNCNSLANYIMTLSGSKYLEQDFSGEMFVKFLLEFMYKHKQDRSFYSKLIAELFTQENLADITNQQIGAFMAMKAWDRYLEGDGDMLQLMIDEISGGLSRDIMLQGVARKIRERKK